VQEKVAKEVVSIFGESDAISYDKIPQLKYLDNVIKETLRLHTVAEVIPSRISTDEVVVMGHKFRKGVEFLMYVGGIHRNPDYWPDPLAFIPDRFEVTPKPSTFLPFGEGPMNCIGQKMSMIEMKVIIAQFVRRFKISITPNQKINFVFSVTNGLKEGLYLDVTARS
jgi:cytochrome P450